MNNLFSVRKILNRKFHEKNLDSQIPQDILALFKDKITTPEKAIDGIKSGDHIFLGTGCATPQTLIMALENSQHDLYDIEIYHYIIAGGFPLSDGKPTTRFFHKAFYADNFMREIIKSGKGDYIPVPIANVPLLIESGALTVDAALIQVSMPDKHGFVSAGVSADITNAITQNAKTVIAELNPNMPTTIGETHISMHQIDKVVLVDTPIIEFTSPKVDDAVAQQIARNVANVIEDGSTLQIGLGRIPNEMLKYLEGCRDIGIHTDVISDSIIDLVENGTITGGQKTLHKGQIVASFCMGTKRLYNLIDGNPLFGFYPIDYVCDPSVIRKNHKMVSVTQAQAIDLMGQVCSDQFHGELSGGLSAQPNFIRGAAQSPHGKPIICIASTTDDLSESRIRPLLREGEGVTIPRSDIHYVVTEYGAAYLFGKSIREKALALIEIAHPNFRDHLLDEAKRLGYVRQDQDLKCKIIGTQACRYPVEEEVTHHLKDGTSVCIRPSRASDVRGLQELFYHLPLNDIYTRFFTGMKSLPVSKAEYLCNVDYSNQMAFVVTYGDRECEKIVGSSLYVVDQEADMADVAYMVLHEWQGKGIGTILQSRMCEYARSKGIKGFTADILPENKSMIKLAEKCGILDKKYVDGVFEIKIIFSEIE